jgi:hypothetical protein
MTLTGTLKAGDRVDTVDTVDMAARICAGAAHELPGEMKIVESRV